jgi:hypothetical protein
MNAKELEAAFRFTRWNNSLSPNNLPSGPGEKTSNPESHTEEEGDDDSMLEGSEMIEDRHRTLASIVGEISGKTSSTLVYEDP